MSVYPDIRAGAHLSGDLLRSMLPPQVWKTTDESVTSSTTLQNDDDLALPVEANATYALSGFLVWTGNETGDIKFGFDFPASSTLHWGMVGPDDTSTGFNSGGTRGAGEWFVRINQTAGGSVIQFAGSTAPLMGLLEGTLFTGATAGTLQLQWAQFTSNGTATTLKAGSRMSLRRLA